MTAAPVQFQLQVSGIDYWCNNQENMVWKGSLRKWIAILKSPIKGSCVRVLSFWHIQDFDFWEMSKSECEKASTK